MKLLSLKLVIRLRFFSILFALIGLWLWGCEQKDEVGQFELYEGPIRILRNAQIIHSDSAKLQGKLTTPELFEFENSDRELPQGGFVEFYDKISNKTTATLKADYGYYTKETEEWKVEGNVILSNIENQETLYTEQLFWNPVSGDVRTEKFVRIESPDRIVTGTGLRTKQDFSNYEILKPEGVFTFEEE